MSNYYINEKAHGKRSHLVVISMKKGIQHTLKREIGEQTVQYS